MRPPSRMRRLSTNPSPGFPSRLPGGHPAILEDHLAGVAGPHAELVFFPADAKTRRAFVDDKRRDAVMRRRPVRHRHRHADFGAVGVGGKRLRAVQHPIVAFPACLLRVPPASEPASGSVSDQHPSHSPPASFGTYLFRLFLGARQKDMVGAQRIVGRHDQRHAGVDACQLFDDNRIVDIAQAGAAQFLGKDHPQKSQVARVSGSPAREISAPRPIPRRTAGFPFRRSAATVLRSCSCSAVNEKSMAPPGDCGTEAVWFLHC